jgi:hypothetical protein
VVALACTPPAEHDVPVTHWSNALLARAVIDHGIADAISAETIRRWLAAMAIKPHRSRYWLNSPDPDFDVKMREIIGLYLDPPPDSIVLCFDERTGMQALERRYPTKPIRPGLIERREFEYIRHGTLDLLAALQVHTGHVYAACYEHHRQWDVADFFAWLLPQMPRGRQIHLVMDNLKVHHTDTVQQVLNRYRHRLHVHWLPLHASWLNQIEIFFSIFNRRVIRRGNFHDADDLADKAIRFIDWYDDHQAKPFNWTYTGHPLAA